MQKKCEKMQKKGETNAKKMEKCKKKMEILEMCMFYKNNKFPEVAFFIACFAFFFAFSWATVFGVALSGCMFCILIKFYNL